MQKIGIIGGSGLSDYPLFKISKTITTTNSYGQPSGPLLSGKIGNTDVVFLPRHGKGHTIPPSQVNYRANIIALKEAACTHIIATTACGSLRENHQRGDFVVLDQFIDFTKRRINTFYEKFEPGNPEHTPMAEPFDHQLRNIIKEVCQSKNIPYHPKGTVVTIEGPRFSTKAESNLFRMFGADVINMSIATECALAKEAKIPYAAIALVTDFDCWKEDEEEVSWHIVLEEFKNNVDVMQQIIYNTIQKINSAES